MSLNKMIGDRTVKVSAEAHSLLVIAAAKVSIIEKRSVTKKETFNLAIVHFLRTMDEKAGINNVQTRGKN